MTLLLAGCQSSADLAQPIKSPVPVAVKPNKPEKQVDQATLHRQATHAKNIWERISKQLEIPTPNNHRIQQQRDWYLRHPQYLDVISERARPFLYQIVQEVEKRNMPLELALLPAVESAFDPFAYSWGSASGLWQIIPVTSKRFGLKEDWWYNGRRDVTASTNAALDYLEYLHRFFDGNWLNAIAAYNSGEGTVLNAIRYNKKHHRPTDFWSLDLPSQTEVYVPKLLALAQIVREPHHYGVKLPELPNRPVLEEVTLKSQFDLSIVSKMAGITESQLRRYNPGFNHWASSPDGPYTLLLPVDKIDGFKHKLAKLKEPQDLLRWTRYQIKSGDSLSVIAHKNRTSIRYLKALNHLKSNTIQVGHHLLIPVIPYETAKPAQSKAGVKNQRSYQLSYTVKPGDSLWRIGHKFKVSYKDIAEWNNLKSGAVLSPGKKLKIWQTIKSKGVIRKVIYKVRRGDSLESIANKFKVTTSDIYHWNQLKRQRYLKPGINLKLFVDVTRLNS